MEEISIGSLIEKGDAEVKTGPFGTQLKASEYTCSGTPVLNVKNLGYSRVIRDKLDYVGDDTLARLSSHILKTGDIVFGRKGAVDRHAYITETENGWMQGSDCIRLRILNGSYNPRYISYCFLTQKHKKFMEMMCSHGTTMASLNQKIIEQISFPCPEREKQDQVVALLESFDKKIECNEKINENLQKQVFAYFDEIMKKHNQADYCMLSELAYINPKRIISQKKEARCVDMSRLSVTGAFPDGWEFKPYTGGMKFVNGDTVLARITPCLENGKAAFISFLDDDEVAFGSTEYIVMASKGIVPPEMLYCLARYRAFVDYAVKNMNGTSGRQRVSGKAIEQFKLPHFEKQEVEEFALISREHFEKIKKNSLENMALYELRSNILPKVLSGEIDVSGLKA